MNKVPLETLTTQYRSLCFSIREKENNLKNIKVNRFVLNKDMINLINELKVLNDQRSALAEEITKAGGTIDSNG